MRKIKLDAKRLHLKKEKIANLTEKESTAIAGGSLTTTLICPLITRIPMCKPDPDPDESLLPTCFTVMGPC